MSRKFFDTLTKKMLVVMTISLLVIIVGCEKSSSNKNANKSTNEEYSYAVISSTMTKDKSIISLYDENGKFIKDKKIKYGGIVLSDFKIESESNGNNVFYVGSAIIPHANHYMLKINKDTLDATTLDTSICPTFFTIDNKYSYAGSAYVDGTKLEKIEIDTNKIINSYKPEVEGGSSLNEKDNKLYLVSSGYEDDKLKMYLTTLNKENLKIEKKISLGGGERTQSTKMIGDYIWVTKPYDEDGNNLNELLKVSIKDFSIKVLKLPFCNMYQTLKSNDYIYITEYNMHGEETKNQIARLNAKNDNVECFKLENNLEMAQIDENKKELLATDGEKMYVYNLNDFTLKRSFELKQYDDLVFASFFIK
ncbi:MAG: hypothetical protein LBR30_06750 [Clostridioides sp.]|jgi:hypothetical protein|nr:hypothetical protein [Clostridioides sp.]